jgi:hypothetical protein
MAQMPVSRKPGVGGHDEAIGGAGTSSGPRLGSFMHAEHTSPYHQGLQPRDPLRFPGKGDNEESLVSGLLLQ